MSEEKRRWQFSIRDVLLIMFIVGLGVGWFVDHRRFSEEVAEMKQAMAWKPKTTYVPGATPYLQTSPVPTSPVPPSTYLPYTAPSDPPPDYIPNAAPYSQPYIPNLLKPSDDYPAPAK